MLHVLLPYSLILPSFSSQNPYDSVLIYERCVLIDDCCAERYRAERINTETASQRRPVATVLARACTPLLSHSGLGDQNRRRAAFAGICCIWFALLLQNFYFHPKHFPLTLHTRCLVESCKVHFALFVLGVFLRWSLIFTEVLSYWIMLVTLCCVLIVVVCIFSTQTVENRINIYYWIEICKVIMRHTRYWKFHISTKGCSRCRTRTASLWQTVVT